MKLKSTATLLVLVSALSIPLVASAGSQSAMTLLNGANQMNNEQQDAATMLRGKAGDNQALVTMADTIREDHKANQSALETLACQKNITLKSYEKSKAAQDELDNLQSAKFNENFSQNGYPGS